jgi:hypothetical protein
MSKVKMTISVPEDLALYLRSKSNVSGVVAEAVEEYRAHELERRLEDSYRQDAEEAEELNREWQSVDAEVSE